MRSFFIGGFQVTLSMVKMNYLCTYREVLEEPRPEDVRRHLRENSSLFLILLTRRIVVLFTGSFPATDTRVTRITWNEIMNKWGCSKAFSSKSRIWRIFSQFEVRFKASRIIKSVNYCGKYLKSGSPGSRPGSTGLYFQPFPSAAVRVKWLKCKYREHNIRAPAVRVRKGWISLSRFGCVRRWTRTRTRVRMRTGAIFRSGDW